MRLVSIRSLVVVAVVMLSHHPAQAQANDTVAAEALFQQGRSLLLADRIAEACPKLAESFRIDPATGTLAALAMCHEKQGKLASAWAEFTDVESRARREGREDRENLAHESARALEPRLSTLELRVPSEVSVIKGLEIRRDGVPQGQAVYNVALPIDGGEHRVEAAAPGYKTWTRSVSVKTEGDRASLAVGMLEPAPASASGTAEPSARKDVTEPSTSGKPFGALEWAGIATAGAGVVALGAGGYFLATALGEKADSENECEGNVCNEAGLAMRSDAVDHGNLATLFGVGGAVLVGTGATLYFIGRSSDSGESARSVSARVSIAATPSAALLHVEGNF